MVGRQIDHVARAVRQSRRSIVGAAVIAIVELTGGRVTGGGSSGQARKKKRKPRLVLNAYGCVDVGGRCAGDSGNCCSNVCQGAKPKKGKKDKSLCVAHNTGGCRPGDDTICQGGPVTKCPSGFCFRTTGNAGFCGDPVKSACIACTRDLECEEAFGAGAACILCPSGNCTATDRRVCVAPV